MNGLPGYVRQTATFAEQTACAHTYRTVTAKLDAFHIITSAAEHRATAAITEQCALHRTCHLMHSLDTRFGYSLLCESDARAGRAHIVASCALIKSVLRCGNKNNRPQIRVPSKGHAKILSLALVGTPAISSNTNRVRKWLSVCATFSTVHST